MKKKIDKQDAQCREVELEIDVLERDIALTRQRWALTTSLLEEKQLKDKLSKLLAMREDLEHRIYGK